MRVSWAYLYARSGTRVDAVKSYIVSPHIYTQRIGDHLVRRCEVCGEVGASAYISMQVLGNITAEFYPAEWSSAFDKAHNHEVSREHRRKGQLI